MTEQIDRELVLKFLKENKTPVALKFTKVSGEVRDMVATLNPDLISTTYEKKTTKTKKANPDTLAIFDTEKEAWRSCRWDSIIGVVP